MKSSLSLLILVVLLTGSFIPVSRVSAQPPIPPGVERLFSSMSPQERVGQLFLIKFSGPDTSQESQIYSLIADHHIGGVILTAAGDNFAASPQTLQGTYDLISSLQRIEWEDSTTTRTDAITGEQVKHKYSPLFIGLRQDGDGYPGDQILSGLTPIPSQMAIGATWDPALAGQVAEIEGQELAALGFNLLLGPSLDVLEVPNPAPSADLGTNVFGGDPFWVSEMAKAYISGLHSGSQDRLLVIAKHFPGRGATNRPSETEIPTVRKSLEQLKQIELAPFFSVTGNAPDPLAAADGLLVSHIRYQGFQGNIRATTRPISFDAQALDAILNLPQFANWRSTGGLIVSEDLGTHAVRDFYSPGLSVFSAREVVRDAFLAGNDLLNLGLITSSGETADSFSTIVNIASFFTQKYLDDSAFAQRVDASVLRILTAKFALYNSLSIFNVIPPVSELQTIGTASDVIPNVANSSATLISPDAQDLAALLPSPPKVRERLVFLTDSVSALQCSNCAPVDVPAVNALQESVIRLYGPQGDNQTSNFLTSSYSFNYLLTMLDGLSPPYIENDINRADWIIISISGNRENQPALISRFLTERQDILREKKVILFSLGAPYYFDSTDISRITAYYSLYSKQPPFIDVAARILFQEIKPGGASPVSIPGINYDLISIMQPAPDQIIPLFIDPKSVAVSPNTASTPEPTPVPLFQIGDTLALLTGTIMDHNGHPVPDGTVVLFSMTLTGEGGGILQQVEAVTTGGVAHASFGLDKPGLLEIHAVSEPATVSQVLQLDVSQTGQVAVTLVVPELTHVADLATPSLLIPVNGDGFTTESGFPNLNAWFSMMLMIALTGLLGWWLGNSFLQSLGGIRLALGILIGGLVAYNYLALGLPGSINLATDYQFVGIAVFVLVGELVGGLGVWLWLRAH